VYTIPLRALITDGSWGRLVRSANALAPAMSAHFENGVRAGGVITLYQFAEPLGISIQAEVGTPEPERLHRYFTISLEKAMRGQRLGEKNSWEADRNPEFHQYGGAFILPHTVDIWLSFSGWREPHDVVFGAYAAVRSGLMQERDVDCVLRDHGAATLELFELYEALADTLEAVPA
jgi:hypothetical protein